MFGAGFDGVDPAPFALVEIGCREQIADGQNAGQRRADFMCESGERGFDDAGGDLRNGTLARSGLGHGTFYNALFRQPPFWRPRRAL